MEAINSLLSNDIAYLNALRHAQPIPPPTTLEIAPPLPSNISLGVPTMGTKNAPKMFKVPTWAWLTLSVVVATYLYNKWKSNQVKENNTSI